MASTLAEVFTGPCGTEEGVVGSRVMGRVREHRMGLSWLLTGLSALGLMVPVIQSGFKGVAGLSIAQQVHSDCKLYDEFWQINSWLMEPFFCGKSM